MQKAYIFDIDGTLAIRGDRSPYDYSKVHLDKLNEDVARVYRSLQMHHYKIIIMSGRDDSCREETIEWLISKGLIIGDIFMRKTGDKRRDSIVKAEMYISQILPHYEVLGVFDDRNQVVDMWRSLGLTCFQVAPGNF